MHIFSIYVIKLFCFSRNGNEAKGHGSCTVMTK